MFLIGRTTNKVSGYLLFNIEFPNKIERDKFEKQEKMKRMFQYADIGYCDCFYYPVWMGYGEPEEILKKCRKNKIKIKKFLSIDLPTNGDWWDVIKQETYKEEE